MKCPKPVLGLKPFNLSLFNQTPSHRLAVVLFMLSAALLSAVRPAAAWASGGGLTIVVMDPLAAPLACDCVAGYAQRDYRRLGAFLEKRIGRPVTVVFGESLSRVLAGEAQGTAHLIIGKDSIVRADAAECEIAVRPIARLTDLSGKTTMTGLFVVARHDPARTVADLGGYRILFGNKEDVEKHAAAKAALKKAAVALPKKILTCSSCAEAALDVIESTAQPGSVGSAGSAAVISSYAKALLEGCQAIEPGEVRVVGRTAPVPFITVFATDCVDADKEKLVLGALLAVAKDAKLLKAMESKRGFVIPNHKTLKTCFEKGATGVWPQWRGPRRDAIVPWLPRRLPQNAKTVWAKPLTGQGISGIAATEKHLIVADRDPADRMDIFRCLDTRTGKQLWTLEYPARGELDYGNSPRATPLIHGDQVFLLGAFGQLHCVALSDGKILWKKDLMREFHAELPAWGMCASPLLVDGKLIVNPGGPEASLVALDPRSGRPIWRTPGRAAAYSSFIVATLGGRRQIVGYDCISLGGWDIAGGRRLWSLVPPTEGDFNVPTPVCLDGRLLASSESNGTRLYEFDPDGKIRPRPIAENPALAPDSSTPVAVRGKVFGCWTALYCLDPAKALTARWEADDEAYEDYAALIASPDRLLIIAVSGELLLVDTTSDDYRLISRLNPFANETEVLSHPALVGTRLFIRNDSTVVCLDLDESGD